MLKKIFFVLLLFITCSCNKEGTFNDIPLDNGMVPESPKENVDFVRLVDNMTKTAGVLTFDGKGDEATLKWIVAEGCNLDTTQTTVPLTDGKGKLPICWDKMLKDSLYGPRDMAFKAGVMVVTKDGSQYFPLLWAYEVDSTKINAKAVQTRAGGVTPRASVIRFIPQTVAMNDVSGATMVVSYTGVNFVVLNYQDFTQSTNVNIDNLPGLVGTDGSTFTELKFRWRTTELPAVPFTAQVLAEADDGYKARGTVTWGADSPSLNISPLEQQLPAEGGEKVGGVSIVTNQFRWSAVTNQSWLSIAPTTGNGADMIYFSPDANPYTVIRTAIVTVTCFNASGNVTIRKTIEVTQDAASATTLAVVPTFHTIAGNGGTVVSNITSNTSWTAVSNASWLAVAPYSGSSNGRISLTASPNMGLTARTAMVTVTAGGKSQNITIIQTGGEQYTVYFRASEGGRVDKTSASGINGQSVFATAIPNSGYKFAGWFNPNSQLLTENVRLERKLTEITNGKTFEARFVKVIPAKSSLTGDVINCTNVRVTGGGRWIIAPDAVHGEYTHIRARFSNVEIVGNKFYKGGNNNVFIKAGRYRVKFKGSFDRGPRPDLAGAAVYIINARQNYFHAGWGQQNSMTGCAAYFVWHNGGNNYVKNAFADWSTVDITVNDLPICLDAQIVGQNLPWGWTTGKYTITRMQIEEL